MRIVCMFMWVFIYLEFVTLAAYDRCWSFSEVDIENRFQFLFKFWSYLCQFLDVPFKYSCVSFSSWLQYSDPVLESGFLSRFQSLASVFKKMTPNSLSTPVSSQPQLFRSWVLQSILILASASTSVWAVFFLTAQGLSSSLPHTSAQAWSSARSTRQINHHCQEVQRLM